MYMSNRKPICNRSSCNLSWVHVENCHSQNKHYKFISLCLILYYDKLKLQRTNDCDQDIKILLTIINCRSYQLFSTISHTFLLKADLDCYPPRVQLEDLNLTEYQKPFDLDQNRGSFPHQGTCCPQLTVRYHIIQSNVHKLKNTAQ